MYSSKLAVEEVAKHVALAYASEIKGVINIGSKRMSSYERFSKYKPAIKKISYKDVQNQIPGVPIATDTSLDSSKWEEYLKEKGLPPITQP